MPPASAEFRAKLVRFIQRQHEARFRVIDNTGDDKKVVGGQFPDIIFMQKEPPPNDNVLFVMKIEAGDLINSVAEWKSLGGAPYVFYIVVPKDNLDTAKRLVNATGVRARFAWFEMEGGNVKEVHYE